MKIHSFSSIAKLALCAGLATFMSCSSAEKRFERITPGMTAAEVRETMDQGPSSFQVAQQAGFSRWHFGDDRCVLFKDERVVAKESPETGRSASVAGAKYEETKRPLCLAPGETTTASTDRTVEVPGIGTIHLPGSRLGDSQSAGTSGELPPVTEPGTSTTAK